MTKLYFISPLMSWVLTLMLIPFLRILALKTGLIDKPNHRKVHAEAVPLIGGISIFISIVLTLALVVPLNNELLVYKNTFTGVVILLIMGILDDRFDLRASLKLSVQLLLAHFVYSQGIMLSSFHGLLGIYELAAWQQYLLTMVIITGVVNAFNLMDGIDGLAAGLAILGFGIFAVLAFLTGKPLMALVYLTFIGALLAFLRFNLSKSQKIFMGDAGSLMIGFVMVVSGLRLIQVARTSAEWSIVTLGVFAVLLVPVFDALRVFRRRVKSGKSPFHADRTHLHHLILISGFKHKAAAILIVGIMLLISVIGYISLQFAGLTLAIFSMLLFFFVLSSLLQFNEKINNWKVFIKVRERENSVTP
ncbi:MAG TPA: MraY family glycosyltransferase [Saprospiraceae bacterium]|nr:MraY family glycosyltransferase [Saprospiraceae bacterium]HRG64787.1 MraY family glycosyltransferase [Saprospiraceae bacterium]